MSTNNFVDQRYTITSAAGVGGSTLLNLMKKTWPHFQFFSAGEYMRDRAQKLGFAQIDEFVQYMQDHPEEEHDKDCDGRIALAGLRPKSVTEGRWAYRLVRGAFHILLVCDMQTRTLRRAKSKGLDPHDVYGLLLERDLADRRRHMRLYGEVQWKDPKFHLVCNTAVLSPEQILIKVTQKHKELLGKHSAVAHVA